MSQSTTLSDIHVRVNGNEEEELNSLTIEKEEYWVTSMTYHENY